MKSKYLSLLAALLLLLPVAALADTISPSSFTATLPVGGTATVTKTLTVSAGPPTTSTVDVYFMADTTGSMGGNIAAVKSSASTILSSISSYGSVHFAVGEYKDFGDSYAYRLNTAMTSSASTAQSGINLWSATGGGDYQEAELYALNRAATDAATGWRAGSTKILVWFGDASGHDPSGGVTEATATASLVGAGIKVQAIDVGSMNDTGQALRIATATGGAYYAGIDSSSIVDTILDAIETAVSTYSNVSLDTSEVPAGIGIAVTPGGYTGPFDRSIDRSFTFDVTFTGLTPGAYSFNIYGTVDGGRVATESDRIAVSGTVPEPATLLLLGCGLLGLAGIRRKMS